MVKANTFSCTIEKKTHNFTLPWKFWNCRGIFDIYRIRLLIDDTFTKKKSSKKKNSREHLYSHLTFCFYVVTNRRQLLNLLLTDIWYKNIQWESLTSFYFLWLPRSKLIQHCTPSASERKKKNRGWIRLWKRYEAQCIPCSCFFYSYFFLFVLTLCLAIPKIMPLVNTIITELPSIETFGCMYTDLAFPFTLKLTPDGKYYKNISWIVLSVC